MKNLTLRILDMISKGEISPIRGDLMLRKREDLKVWGTLIENSITEMMPDMMRQMIGREGDINVAERVNHSHEGRGREVVAEEIGWCKEVMLTDIGSDP